MADYDRLIEKLKSWSSRELTREEKDHYSGYIYGELAYEDAQEEVRKILEEFEGK